MPSQLDMPPLTEPIVDPETGLVAPRWRPWISRLSRLIQVSTERGSTADRPTEDRFIGQVHWNTTTGRPEWWDGSAWQEALLAADEASAGGTLAETDNANTFTKAQSAPQFTLTGGPSGTPAAHALYQDNVPKAWAQFDGTGTAALQDSFNVSGFADNGTGHYTLTWDRDFANANYAMVVTNNDIGIASVAQAHATGSADVKCFVSNTAGTLNDETPVSVVAFGDQ